MADEQPKLLNYARSPRRSFDTAVKIAGWAIMTWFLALIAALIVYDRMVLHP